MPILRTLTHGLTALALGTLCFGASFAAVTVTDIKVGKQGPDLTISYRLNQAATSVNIQVGAQSFSGPTAKGLNVATVPGSLAGQTATITATAPAIAGTGGAEVIVPFTQHPSSNRYTGIDVVTRPESPYKGRIFAVAGFLQPGFKRLFAYYPDGSLVAEKDLTVSSGYSSGSFPFGMALIQKDPQDRLIISNRTSARILLYNPDLSQAADLPGRYTYPGCEATPLQDSSGVDVANGINTYLGGNLTNEVQHDTYDLSTGTRTAIGTTAIAGQGDALVQAIAVDPKNQVMFKAQSASAATIATNNVQKWVSTDYGLTWTEDAAWNSTFSAAIGADSAGVALGVAMDKGFNASNLAASYVWVCVSGAAGPASLNKIYRVNAATGAIDATATIDLKTVTNPTGSADISNNAGHFLAVDAAGNIVLTVGNTGNQNASYWGVLAPNTSGPTSDVATVSLIPPAYVDLAISPTSVGNTGSAQLTFTATAFDPKGIVADNVQVSVDLAPIGGSTLNLTQQSVSGDGLTGVYTGSYTVPANAPLGGKDIQATMTTATSGSPTVKTGVSIYNAYVPAWTTVTDGGVSTSVAGNGNVAYVGTDTGKIIALNTTTGAPVAMFGSNGVATVSGPVSGNLLLASGRLYAITATGVDILNSGRGTKLGAINVANAVDVAAHPGNPAVVYVSAGNYVYKVNAATGAQLAQSADLGAKANRMAVGSAVPGGGSWVLALGTEGDGTGANGKIVMLDPDTLTQMYPSITDPAGAVRSRPVFVNVSDSPVFGIGGASGLWGVDATSGTLLPWTVGTFSTGNPYQTSAPADGSIAASAANEPTPRFFVCTRGSATAGGQILVITASSGERVSFGGYPAQLTAAGSGFAAGSGIVAHYGANLVDAALTRPMYIGSDANSRMFFALETLPDATDYNASPAKKHIFDPNDTATFPGAVAGAFPGVAAQCGNRIITGSTAGRAYGFPALTVTEAAAVTASSPANGADGVSTSANITLTFDKDISSLFIDNSIVKLLDQDGNEVSAFLQASGTTLTIDPDVTLTANRYYSVAVYPVVNQFQPFSAIFYTGTLVVPFDVNKDGQFNADDVKATLRVAAGLLNATAIDKAQADVNGDGKVTLEDAEILDRKLNGK
jgi:methionine-rich copper-binding protein CopC